MTCGGIVRGGEWRWFLVGHLVLEVRQHKAGCHSGSYGVLRLFVLSDLVLIKEER